MITRCLHSLRVSLKKSCLTIALVTASFSLLSAEARTWTATDGRELEGELIEFDALTVTLKVKGKVHTFSVNRLSAADRAYLEALPDDWKERNNADPDNQNGEGGDAASGKLFGEELVAGKRYEFLRDLSPETIEDFSKHRKPATKMKIVVQLPENYRPDGPQKVFWTSCGLNTDGEWAQGNIGQITWIGKSVLEKGFIIIAADTEHGGPIERNSPKQNVRARDSFQSDVFTALESEWPEIKSWKHVAAGFSGNGKASFYRIAQLLKADYNVVGHFVGGCNNSLATQAAKALKVRKGQYRPVKLWVSTGTRDPVVPLARIPGVIGDCKKAGYRKVKKTTYDAAHDFSFEQFSEALDWFTEEK